MLPNIVGEDTFFMSGRFTGEKVKSFVCEFAGSTNLARRAVNVHFSPVNKSGNTDDKYTNPLHIISSDFGSYQKGYSK